VSKVKHGAWRRCKPNQFRRVDFALSPAIVELVATAFYYPSPGVKGGRVYHVIDCLTGAMDFVGLEYLKREADPND
jgi:hypothetical protein